MKTARKTLSIVSIVSLVVAVLMLILSVFGVKGIYKYPSVAVLESMSIICVGSALAINALLIFPKKKRLAIVDLSLLGSLTLLSIITFWVEAVSNSFFGKIVLILGIATIFFNIIVSNYLKLGKNKLALQVITYSLIVILDILLTLQILGINLFDLDWFSKVFIVLCLITFVMLIVLLILAKKSPDFQSNADKTDYIKVDKKEYDAMKLKIQELEKELQKLKSEEGHTN